METAPRRICFRMSTANDRSYLYSRKIFIVSFIFDVLDVGAAALLSREPYFIFRVHTYWYRDSFFETASWTWKLVDVSIPALVSSLKIVTETNIFVTVCVLAKLKMRSKNHKFFVELWNYLWSRTFTISLLPFEFVSFLHTEQSTRMFGYRLAIF